MGLSASAHGALIGMTKLINWTLLFRGTDRTVSHTTPRLASHSFNGDFSHCAKKKHQHQRHMLYQTMHCSFEDVIFAFVKLDKGQYAGHVMQ